MHLQIVNLHLQTTYHELQTINLYSKKVNYFYVELVNVFPIVLIYKYEKDNKEDDKNGNKTKRN